MADKAQHTNHPRWTPQFVGVIPYTDPDCPACTERPVVAKCGRQDPHGGHVFLAINGHKTFCSGNQHVITARVSPFTRRAIAGTLPAKVLA